MTASSGHGAAAPARLRYRRVFPGEERQIRELRRWLSDQLPERTAGDDVMTVAAELATNAVKHTSSGRGGWFTVEVSWHCAAVLIAVTDQGAPSGPRLTGGPDPLAESGRGLQVVRGLSARTGVAGDCDGRVVWAELPRPGDMPELACPGGAPELPGAGGIVAAGPQGPGRGGAAGAADGRQARRRSAAQRVS